MQKLTIILAGLLGVLLGLWYFVTQTAPRAQRCKQARGLSRHILLTGILVSALVSYIAGCALKPISARKTGSSPTARSGHRDHLDALAETQQWRELRVMWNLLTGDQRVFEDEKNRDLLTYSLNRQLYGLVVRLRLDEIRELSLLSEVEQAALGKLFETMSSHYFSKRSGMTCYLMTMEGARLVEGRDGIEQQTQLLRKHYRQGTLSSDVVAKIEDTIVAKLGLLDVLNEEDAGLLTEKDIRTRAAEWFEQGRIGSITPDRWQREELIKEILAEKNSAISEKNRQLRARRWLDHRSRLTKTVIALGQYTPDANAEKDILAALKGRSIPLKALAAYLRDVESSGRARLVPLYVERAGRKAIPLLKELLEDEEIRVSGEQNGCVMSFPVRTAAARQLAMLGISTPGYEDILGPPPKKPQTGSKATPQDGLTVRERITQELLLEASSHDPYHGNAKTYSTSTPEAKAMLKQLLRSRSVKVLGSAIWSAGLSRDHTMIPLLEKIATKHTELHDEIARALEDIGHSDGLPLLRRMVEGGTTASCYIFPAVVAIGGDEAAKFCERLVFESASANTQTDAVAYLVQMQKEKAVPVLLKALEQKRKPFLRIYAGRYLQRLGNDAALPIAMELVKSQDKRVQNVAFDILASADDEVSGQLLSRFVDDQAYARKAVISLMRRGGKLAATTLKKVMASESQDLQDAALSRCAYVEFPGIEGILLEASKHPSDRIRRRAIQALCSHATDKSVTILREMLTTTPELREDIRSTLRGITQRRCEQRCADIMKRKGGGKPESLSTDDMFALLVLKLHEQYGPDADRRQEFARGVVNTPGISLVPAIVRYFSDYDHDMYDSQFMSSECEELMRILDKKPKDAVRPVLAFVQDGRARNRELGLGFLGGRGYGRDPYPLEEIPGLGDVLEECLGDKDPQVAAEAKRLKAIAAAEAKDRAFTVALYDLQTPRDRAAALTALRYPQWGRVTFTQEQKQLLVPAIAGVVREIARNPGRERQPWSAVEIATKLGDQRLLPALSTLVLSYDPDSANEYGSRRIREVVQALRKHGVDVTRKADGRYAIRE